MSARRKPLVGLAPSPPARGAVTKTGFYEIKFRAATPVVRNRWVAQLQRIFPSRCMDGELQLVSALED